MAVFRVEKTKRFTIMSNHHLNNPDLSLKAKGLLSLMLSLPEDWDYTSKGLARICREGVDAIATALKELEQYGYLTRRRLRDEAGRLTDIEYTIHEIPVEAEDPPEWWESPEAEEPEPDYPELENPILDNLEQEIPRQGNPVQQNTNILNTYRPNTERQSTDQSVSRTAGAGSGGSGMNDMTDVTDNADAYRALIKRNIGYGDLAKKYGGDRVDEVVELILEVVIEEKPVDLISMYNRDPNNSPIVVKGMITHISRKNTWLGRPIVRFRITDYTDIRLVQFFVTDTRVRSDLLKILTKGTFILLKGEVDSMDSGLAIMYVKGIYLIPAFKSPEEEERDEFLL